MFNEHTTERLLSRIYIILINKKAQITQQEKWKTDMKHTQQKNLR